MTDIKRLSELSVGECGCVTRVGGECGMQRRFLDIGLTPGTVVRCVGKSPLGDPRAYLVRGVKIAIRRRDSADIEIK